MVARLEAACAPVLERRATEAGETWQEWDAHGALITMRGTAHKRPDVGLRKQRCLLMGVISTYLSAPIFLQLYCNTGRLRPTQTLGRSEQLLSCWDG